MYHPNGIDNHSRPKDEPVAAIVVGYGKKELPTEKDEKGNVTKSEEVATVNLLLLQDNAAAPVLHRSNVVEKSKAESEALKYKLPFYVVPKGKKEEA